MDKITDMKLEYNIEVVEGSAYYHNYEIFPLGIYTDNNGDSWVKCLLDKKQVFIRSKVVNINGVARMSKPNEIGVSKVLFKDGEIYKTDGVGVGYGK